MKILKDLREKFNISREKLMIGINLPVELINNYENKTSKAPLQNLILISNFFNYSIDYLTNEGETENIKCIKLIKLAKEFDTSSSDQRYQIESTATTLLSKHETKPFNNIQDNINIELTNSFHENLKRLRLNAELSQTELGKDYNISARMISGYEKDMTPPYDKLSYLAGKLDISVHALVTGEKLNFAFDDKHFGNTMLKADHFLSIDHHKFLIELMEVALKV